MKQFEVLIEPCHNLQTESTLDEDAEKLLAMQSDDNDDAVAFVDANVALEVPEVPGYDLEEAMRTPGCLVDTHCHLDFICRKLRWQVELELYCFGVLWQIL